MGSGDKISHVEAWDTPRSLEAKSVRRVAFAHQLANRMERDQREASMADRTNAERKRRMRDKRRSKGLTEVRVWLSAKQMEALKAAAGDDGLSVSEAIVRISERSGND